MAGGNARSSVWPIWVGAIVGGLAGYAVWPLLTVATLPVGFALGWSIKARRDAALERAAQQRRIDELFERVALLEYALRRGVVPEAGPPPAAAAGLHPAPAPVGAAAEVAPSAASGAPPVPMAPELAVAPVAARNAGAAPPPRVPAEPGLIERGIAAAKSWLLGGNTVARVGLLVLFIGVAFLLRYLAEHTRIPIELRLAAVALGGVVLLVFGWRLRERRPGYAVTLQGGAVGILYLTVFAALRLYDVLPALPAFALLAALAVLSAVLSIAQNARALAALGATGGFLAPLLVSTGSGRIELLLSYYLLLNLGVLGIAWFRAWRELNWIAFAFTFGVMGLWAFESYLPSALWTGQGFLAAFWLLFLGVSLLYALRQPAATRGLFDTTLMFALPLAAFGIETRFAAGVELALASVIAAAAYLGSSALLLKRRDASLRVLAEASFGVGIAFLTLAVPLAASAQWTAAAWALEGVALLWVGLRQQRWLPLLAGMALHGAAAIALAHAVDAGTVSIAPQWNGLTLNLLVLAGAAFVGAWLLARAVANRASYGAGARWMVEAVPWGARLVGWGWTVALLWQPLAYPWYVPVWCVLAIALLGADRRVARASITPEWVAGLVVVGCAWLATEARAGLDEAVLATFNATTLLRLAVVATAVTGALLSLAGPPVRRAAAAALLTLGALTWLVALYTETLARLDDRLAVVQVTLLVVVATGFALAWLGQRLRWNWPVLLSWAQFAVHGVVAAVAVLLAVEGALLPSRHFGWFAWPLAWAAFVLRLRWDEGLPVKLAQPGVVHVGGLWLVTAMVAAEAALRVDAIAGDGWFYGVWGAVPAVALWLVVQFALKWPMRAAPFAYATFAAPGLALFSLGWTVVASLATPGSAAPLPYVPLLNPLDLSALLALAAVLRWHLADHRRAWQPRVRALLAAVAFIALNAGALRAVHAFTAVPWTVHDLGRSLVVQSVLSLLWTATAMVLMVFAHRRALRPMWVAGAALLGAVVLKLFFVDLAGKGTIEQIVSFVGVGLLILAIGYMAPVPPAAVPARSAT
jgi:uncharacterized membrane protein